MSNAKQIGEVIKEPRKRKEMTQEEQLANMLGISILAASFYKNGVFKAIPSINLAKMSRGVNIPNEEAACISTNETVDELKPFRLAN
jgi:transcriptional regulator with XRE-family HTH domain